MEGELLELRTFDEGDIDQLIAAIPDARAHLQWAGPEYSYPLDAPQLKATLAKTRGERPSFKMYKAVLAGAGETVGHAQLMDIDHAASSCVLGKILIFPPRRGEGLGTTLVKAVLHEAFAVLRLQSMTLMVFDFNEAAIAAYKRAGFAPFPPYPGPLSFQGESWQAVRMALSAERWREHCGSGAAAGR